MKPYILSLILALTLLQPVVARQSQQPSECSITDGCLTYSLNGATQHDEDTYVLSYTITVNCSSRLEYVAFQLPEGSDADEPSNYYAAQSEFTVQDGKKGGNKVETNYNAIQFTAKTNTNISNGASYTFKYAISVADYNDLSKIQVQAKVAGAAPSNVSFDHRVCAPLAATPAPEPQPMPDCRIDLGAAVFGFTGATNNGDGTTTLGFIIQNNMTADAEAVAVEIPGAPEGVTVEASNNGDAYHASYKYKATYSSGILTFTAQNTQGFANGATDTFVFNIPTDEFNPEELFTLTLETGDQTVTTGFNTVTCEDSPITPLPVELLSFKGKATPSGVDLTWETASEKDNDHFEVERSTDSRSFEKVGTVKGAGTTTIKQQYAHTDYVSKAGVYYYRLRQVDYDGTFNLSKTIAVKIKALPGSGRFAVYPNPAVGAAVTVSVAGTGADVNGGILQITDMSGKVMHSLQVTPGSREIDLSLPGLRLAKGMYVVNLLLGDDKQTQKLIIQ